MDHALVESYLKVHHRVLEVNEAMLLSNVGFLDARDVVDNMSQEKAKLRGGHTTLRARQRVRSHIVVR